MVLGHARFAPARAAEIDVQRERQVLVVGGSRGSRSLNQNVPRALAGIPVTGPGWSIVHQAGQNETAETQSLYETCGVRATVVPFIDDLPQALALAVGDLPSGGFDAGRIGCRRHARHPLPLSPGGRRPSAPQCGVVCRRRRLPGRR